MKLLRLRRYWFYALLVALVVIAYLWGPLQEWDHKIWEMLR